MARKRVSRAVSAASRKIKRMTQRTEDLQRKNWSLKKQLERMKKKQERCVYTTPGRSAQVLHASTPRSKAKADLRKAGISPRKAPSLAKKLEFGNCIVREVEEACATKKWKSKLPLLSVVTGRIMKKYRQVSRLSKHINVSRQQLTLVQGKVFQEAKKSRMSQARSQLHHDIVDFMEREDNSTCLPGKLDATKSGSEKKQTHVLTDYLHNVHNKYLCENPHCTVSLAAFCKARPPHVKLASFATKNTCLCQRHQNMVLKIKPLKARSIISTANPDVLIRENTDDEITEKMNEIDGNIVHYSEWKKVNVESAGRVFNKMKVVDCESSKQDYIMMMKKNLLEFREHTHRVDVQFKEVRNLKQSLPKDHVVCQMDFSENYKCSQAEEVQSAYFNQGMVTLHPVVAYYRTGEESLCHQSYVFVSDETTHNAATVLAIMQKLVPKLQELVPNLKVVHYVTDSPTSQYRNKYIFHVIAKHEDMFSVKASWQYFEAGHGKGPCDGVGGTTKRMADEAVTQQKAVIQDANDFFAWGMAQEQSKMHYIYIPSSSCQASRTDLDTMSIKPVKGTMQVHAVVPTGGGSIAVRNTSCFCIQCFSDGCFHPSCEGWKEHTLISDVEHGEPDIAPVPQLEENADVSEDHNGSNASFQLAEDGDSQERVVSDHQNDRPNYQKSSFVAARYDDDWYIGQVQDHDDADQEYQITFMANSSRKRTYSFKWPAQPDVIWVPESDVLCDVGEPQPSGRSRRVFTLDQKDIDNILSCV